MNKVQYVNIIKRDITRICHGFEPLELLKPSCQKFFVFWCYHQGLSQPGSFLFISLLTFVHEHAVLIIFWSFQMMVIVNQKLRVKNTNSGIPLNLMFTKNSEMCSSCAYTRGKHSLVSVSLGCTKIFMTHCYYFYAKIALFLR